MDRSYYFSIHGQQVGPLDEEAIRKRLEQGQLTPATLAWCEGMAEWQAAGTLDELTEVFPGLRAAAQPPPLPGSPPPPPPGDGRSSAATPEGLSPLEASAYRFVLSIFRSWGGRSTPVRSYVLADPKRALPVAAATLVVMALVLFSLPSFFETTPEPEAPGQQQVMQQPPVDWREGYRAQRDAQLYGQGVTDEVIRGSQRSWDRQSDSYRCGTYGMCGDNN